MRGAATAIAIHGRSSQPVAAAFARMQERQGLRSRAARRLHLVHSGRLTRDLGDARNQAKAALSPWNGGVSSGGIGVSWRSGRWPPSAPPSWRRRRGGRRRRSPRARWRPTIPRASTARPTASSGQGARGSGQTGCRPTFDVGWRKGLDRVAVARMSQHRDTRTTAAAAFWTRVPSGRGIDTRSLTQASSRTCPT